MAKFEITYIDPETEETKTVIKDFSETNIPGEMVISAREWAKDCAYAISDKGTYTIKEL